MSYERKFPDWEQKIIEASKLPSAAQAAASLSIKYDTYRKYAIKYGCFKTNQSGKGIPKKASVKISLHDIIHKGLHPQYQSNKLRIRLLKEKVFEHICSKCKNTEWIGAEIPLELEHKDGNPTNHLLSNLELLCPNCHAQTATYRGKNKK